MGFNAALGSYRYKLQYVTASILAVAGGGGGASNIGGGGGAGGYHANTSFQLIKGRTYTVTVGAGGAGGPGGGTTNGVNGGDSIINDGITVIHMVGGGGGGNGNGTPAAGSGGSGGGASASATPGTANSSGLNKKDSREVFLRFFSLLSTWRSAG